MKKNILFFLFILSLTLYSQNIGCMDVTACNYDSSAIDSGIIFNEVVNTGSNMNIGLITGLDDNLIVGDLIGAFVIQDDFDNDGEGEDDNYYCVGQVNFEGANTTLDIYGDDPLTLSQDGCNVNQTIFFFVKREINEQQYVVFETDVIIMSDDLSTIIPNTYQTNGLGIFSSFNVLNNYFGCEYAQDYYSCSGDCVNDNDNDQICDEQDDCIGQYDACGICNGMGYIDSCGVCDDDPLNDDTSCQQYTYVPDDNFEQALIELGYDDIVDDFVITNNINNVLNLSISNLAISDLTGIEDFTSLNYLNCYANNLLELDVSSNLNLTDLICNFNSLSQLNISNNNILVNLYCDNNNLLELDVSENSLLENLICHSNDISQLSLLNNNSIKSLDLRDNTLSELFLDNNNMLETLKLGQNNLSDLDISNNTQLIELYLNNNNLSALDVSNNGNLIKLDVWGNNLSFLDVLNLAELNYLYVNNNNLMALDVSNNNLLTELYLNNNNLIALDVSNNTLLTELYCMNNNISCIQVWDLSVTQEENFLKDNDAIWSLNCQEEYGCVDEIACNYNPEVSIDDGSCEYPFDLFGSEYVDCNDSCINDEDNDEICDEEDDCVGQYDECEVCNGSGPTSYYDCNGSCINDVDGDTICDELEESGCTDVEACNYNPTATDDDGSCYSELLIDYLLYPPACEDDDGEIVISVLNGSPPYSYNWNNGLELPTISDLPVGEYYLVVTDAVNCIFSMEFELTNDEDNDDVCDSLEVLGCDDVSALNYDILATENDGSCVYCASFDFTDNENGLSLNGLGFENATGVTISFWIYDDNWSLSQENEDGFGYLIDLGDEDSYRYVIRWRDGVKGIQAWYEGSGFEELQGLDCDGNGDDTCYNQNQTAATYIIPPYDYVSNPNIYNWWEEGECTWKNITVVFCSNAVKLYIDGQMVQQRSTNLYYPIPIFSLEENSPSMAGAKNDNTQAWDGKMDEIRIWSRALSDFEIQERLGDNTDINLNILGEQQNEIGKLEGYWKFDSLSLSNQITGINGSVESLYSFAQQYCNYSCDNTDYIMSCSNDCDACTPAEGCMDENADNFDPSAEIDDGLCTYYGCMDDGTHIWSHIPGLQACNYDSTANVNQYSMTDFQNPCIYPMSIYGVGYVDCNGNCLYDCDGDGACDWNQTHCYDTEGNLLSTLDQIDNETFEPGPDGELDCLSFTYVDSVDNCVFNSGVDFVNNITLEEEPDGVPDCLEGFDYSIYYNPLQTDVDNDGIGNSCDNDDGGQVGCMDVEACNYDFWADINCEDCCIYCYLNDCDMYPTTYFVSDISGYINGPYDCSGYCIDVNQDGIPDDIDEDSVCDMVDNCINIWNPGQIDSDLNGVGDACDEVALPFYTQIPYIIYPNPFSDYTIIKFENIIDTETVIQIFEISGRLVYESITMNSFEKIYRANLTNGFYIIEINQDDFTVRDILIVK